MSLRAHPDFDRLARAMTRARKHRHAWTGIFFRVVSPQYAKTVDLKSGEGARRHGGRWNPPGVMRAVYGALTVEGAMRETLGNIELAVPHTARSLPRVIASGEARLRVVLDVTKANVRKLLRVSRKALVEEDWGRAQDSGSEALAQALGRAAFEAGFEALLVPSAAYRRGVNLVVFPDRLEPGSTLAARGVNFVAVNPVQDDVYDICRRIRVQKCR